MDAYKRDGRARTRHRGLTAGDCAAKLDEGCEGVVRAFAERDFDALSESCETIEVILATHIPAFFARAAERGIADFAAEKLSGFAELETRVLVKLLRLVAALLGCEEPLMIRRLCENGGVNALNEMLRAGELRAAGELLVCVGEAANDMCREGIEFRFVIDRALVEEAVRGRPELYETACTACYNIAANSEFDEYHAQFVEFLIEHYDASRMENYVFAMLFRGIKVHPEEMVRIIEKTGFAGRIGVTYVDPPVWVRECFGDERRHVLSEVTCNFVKLILKTMKRSGRIREEVMGALLPDEVLRGIMDAGNEEGTVAVLWKLMRVCVGKMIERNERWMVQVLIDQGFQKSLRDSVENGSSEVRIGALRMLNYCLSMNVMELIENVLDMQFVQNVIGLIDPETEKSTVEMLECLTYLVHMATVNNVVDLINVFNDSDFNEIIEDCAESNYQLVSDKALKLINERKAAFNMISN